MLRSKTTAPKLLDVIHPNYFVMEECEERSFITFLQDLIMKNESRLLFEMLERTGRTNDLPFIEKHLFRKTIELGMIDIYSKFIILGVEVSEICRPPVFYFPLVEAFRHRRIKIFKDLLKRSRTYAHLVFVEALKCDFSSVSPYIEHLVKMKYIDPNQYDENCEPPLFTAIQYGRVDTCTYLLENGGVDVNLLYLGKTPCSVAIESDYFDIFQLLVNKGFKIDHKEGDGFPCLLKQSLCSMTEFLEYLLHKKGADPNHSCSGTTLLCDAIKTNRVDLVDLLLKTPAIDINLPCTNPPGISPIAQSIITENFSFFKTLIERGAGVNESGSINLVSLVLTKEPSWIVTLIESGVWITREHIGRSCHFNGERIFRNYYLLLSEKRRRDQEILMSLLWSRKYLGETAKIFNDRLPFPILRQILKLAEIPPVFPPGKIEAQFLKRVKLEMCKSYDLFEDAEVQWSHSSEDSSEESSDE